MKSKLPREIAALLFFGVSAVRADSSFVTNFGINTITKYDEEGNGSLFTNAFVNGPTGIAIDSSGNIYVSTQDNTIERFAADGTDLGVFASTGLNNPSGLAFDRAGNLYAASFDGNTIEKFAPEGTDLGVFASVIQPTGLAFDAAGNLCVSSLTNSIWRFAADGTPLTAFVNPVLNQPQGLAFDSSGILYVANSGSDTIETFSPAGDVLATPRQTAANPTPPPAADVLAQDVYIAYRTDGLPGLGTLHNPFDGSTQAKLDAIFKWFFDARTSNLTFHIGPGTFQMKGAWDNDWGLLSGWHIQGAGRDLTIIQQVVGALGVNPGSNGALFSTDGGLAFDNQSVEDLTCDCAWFRNGPGGDNSRPHGNFQGINLCGANATMRNVKVTGCGWQDGECFAILSSGGVYDLHLPDNALFENVEVSNGATGEYSTHLTGMAMINLAAMGNDPTPIYAKNGRIINCTFNLPDAGNAGGPPAGYDGGVISGCTFVGYDHGVFYDTFVSRNITIVGNSIKALHPDGNGILFNSGTASTPCENISIIGNNVFSAGGIGFASGVKNSTILGNSIRLAPGNNADNSIFLNTTSVQDIRVLQNTIQSGLSYFNGDTTGCWFRTNRTPAGNVAIPDTIQPPDIATEATNYGIVDALDSIGLSGPVGLAFDNGGNLHVVNALNSTVGISAGATQNTVATAGFSSAFIAVQQTPRLLNVSTRLNVLTGDNVLTGGFIIVGPGTKRVLIRGLGPSLGSAGVGGVLADPTIELHSGSTDAIIASNDNWKDNQQTEIEAAGIPPSTEAEAAIIATLGAGAYTVIERGRQNTTGVGLIEIYDLDAGLGPEVANISTRGFVDTASNVMIAGFIADSRTGGSGQVIVRALGPSLGAAGISNPLANPVLELHDRNGAVIASNDNWKSDQQTEIAATGLPPSNDAEAAILTTLAPGSYTAVASGREGGSGVGLIEVYNLH